MCGIVGIAVHKGRISQAHLQNAASNLHHRGPDHNAHWVSRNKKIAFAHQRLSIIDTRSCAHQPLHYANRYVIIYNGEIYNYPELKKALQAKGLTFFTESDTEVIAAAYHAYGKACVHHFDGAFAFAIWDEQEQKLFAARDRFGEKPFFFFYDQDRFCFASEMKALWQVGVSKEVNRALLYNFLTIGYTANPADPNETFYQYIYKLPAASLLEYNGARHQVEIEKYWMPQAEENTNISEREAIAQLRELLSQSVHNRLRSDVLVGSSLSGGLDSSAIVAHCAQNSAAQYSHQCFTATFAGFEKNEQAYAAKVAKSFGLQHNIIPVGENDLLQQMDALMYHQEEPIGSASSLAQYKVYAAAKAAGITVLLDGQGADEVLAGYHKYYKWYWQQLYRQRKLKRSGELEAARAIGVQEGFGLKNKLAALLPDYAAAMLQSSKAKTAARHPYLDTEFATCYKRNLYYTLPTQHHLNGVLYYNTFVNGLEELLRIADRNSMANSVEVRLPFLNHQLVEFLFTLPPHFKIHQGWTKWLLRKSMEGVLPDDIVWRKDKVGFEPPQQQWMQSAAVRERITEGKKKLVEQGILSTAALQHYKPHPAHAANAFDWRCWSASYLFWH